QRGDRPGVRSGGLELDQDLHLAEREAALVDHPEDVAAGPTHAAQQKGAELQRELAGGLSGAGLLGAGRCFHIRKGYIPATISVPKACVTCVTLESTALADRAGG